MKESTIRDGFRDRKDRCSNPLGTVLYARVMGGRYHMRPKAKNDSHVLTRDVPSPQLLTGQQSHPPENGHESRNDLEHDAFYGP